MVGARGRVRVEMKKDKKWFIDKWTKERNKTDVHDPMYHFINEFIADVNQLDEPEVLSQEWIDDHKVARINNLRKMTTNDVVSVDDLQNLLVPKQEVTEAQAWLDGYVVEEEPLYYALVKGHELLGNTIKYWANSEYDSEDLFISYDQRDDSPIIVKNTKNRWNELGINDSIAIFEKVEDE